ncbi:MAG: hypothetical protein ACAH79_02095 [Thermoleophilia bacterium]
MAIRDWYEREMVDGNRSGAFWLLLSLLITFVIVRTITRRIRSDGEGQGVLRDVSVGGLHIHHLVYGIGLTLVAGFLEFRFQPDTPWFELLAIVFGIGAGLMLDEFALSLYMKDVYWADQGRTSVDAVLIALMIGGLCVIGTAPLELEDARDGSRLALAIAVGVNALLAALTLLKGKIVTGLVGIFVPVVALVGAIRLAKPRSPWARVRYGRRPLKQERSERRFGPTYDARMNRLRDLLGGAPSKPAP